MTAKKLSTPFTVHFLSSRTVHVRPGIDGAQVFSYGQELEVTDEVIQLNTDRNGRCALVEAAESGVSVAVGPWPEGKLRTLPGSYEHDVARERARQEAHRISDPQERARALEEVRALYGAAPTSRTLSTHRPKHG